MTLIEVL
jgi:hypothetical protein